jgi:hypothetical protein
MPRGANVKKFLAVFLLFGAASLPAAAQNQQPIRVNCGGPNYTDSKGQLWKADYGYDSGWPGNPITVTIAGTTDQSLYKTARYAQTFGSVLKYSFQVSPGAYHVNLHFSEVYWAAQKIGGRVFNVKLQGANTFQNLDIFAAVGPNTALVKGADILAPDGNVTIELDSIVQVAKIDAIEIVQTLAMPPLNLSFVYPDGTPVAGTLNYNVTSGATNGTVLTGSQPLNSGHVTCLLISSPQLLGLTGTMNVNLGLTDSAGHSLWQITLTLNPATANFTAVQSSTLQVVVQKQ